MRLSSILLILFFVAGCASPLTPMQMEQYQKNIERAQQMQYASWLQQNKGKPVNTGYFRLQNYTQQTFIISLIHPDTQKEYHRITLPPTSEGWFPARDNKNKLIIGHDWGLRTTYQSGGSTLLVLSDQIGCTYASGRAYQNHYGVDQNFYNCKYGVSDAKLTKYALFESPNNVSSSMADSPQNELTSPGAKFPNWKFTENINQTYFVFYNFTPKDVKIELWNPKSKLKYDTYLAKADRAVRISKKSKNINGNWGFKFADKGTSEVRAIHEIAKLRGATNADGSYVQYWYYQYGDHAASQKRRAEKERRQKELIAEQKRLEATPEYQAKMARQKLARNQSQCRDSLNQYKYSYQRTLEIIKEDNCDKRFQRSYEIVNSAFRNNWFENYSSSALYDDLSRCVEKEKKTELQYIAVLRKSVSQAKSRCSKAAVSTKEFFNGSTTQINNIESNLIQRRNSQLKEARQLADSFARGARAAQQQRQARREAAYQDLLSSIQKHGDMNNFYQSIGHDSSSSGVMAKSQQIVQNYIRAQKHQKQMSKNYDAVLAQMNAQTAKLDAEYKNKPEFKYLSAREKCVKDKAKDHRLYWDTRSNKCMLKMYENTEINMKDIGVATTGNNATTNTRSSANNQTTSRTSTGANSTTNNSATSTSSVSGNRGKSQDADASSSTSNQVPPSATFKARSVVTGEPISKEGTPGPWGKVFHVSNKEFGVEPWWPVSGFKGLKARASCADDDYGSVYTNYWLRNTTNDTVWVRGAFKLVDTHNNEKQTVITYDVKPGEDKHISGSYMKGRCQFDNLQIFVRAEQVRYRKDKGKAIDAT